MIADDRLDCCNDASSDKFSLDLGSRHSRRRGVYTAPQYFRCGSVWKRTWIAAGTEADSDRELHHAPLSLQLWQLLWQLL